MDPIARTRLETLLASLPSGHDRQHLIDRFVGGDVLLGQRTTAEDHARVVLDLIEDEGTDLRNLFAELRERHPERRSDIEAVEALTVSSVPQDEDRPTEMLDPAALAAALADHKARTTPPAGRNLASPAALPPAALPPAALVAAPSPAPAAPAPAAPAAAARSLLPAWAVVLVGVMVLGGLAWVVAASARP